MFTSRGKVTIYELETEWHLSAQLNHSSQGNKTVTQNITRETLIAS